ncbi:hypothetical protein CEXT_401181 [Caerostris extrusa]|uniref:Uncharacterized protein n=1 Tax=Caerostris extrusa TaxID=172846 RepID=A0AAV4PZE0_CAEEX|nr:hypothetical protein CEXT_401181 [Caerostris extrusa]
MSSKDMLTEWPSQYIGDWTSYYGYLWEKLLRQILQQLGVFGSPPTHRNFNGLSSRNMFSHPNLLFSFEVPSKVPGEMVHAPLGVRSETFEKFLEILLLCSVAAPSESFGSEARRFKSNANN